MRPAILMALVALGCDANTPTQVLVVFEADETVEAMAARLQITVTNPEGATQDWDVVIGEEGTGFPVTLPLVPRGGDAARTYRVEAELRDATGSILATLRARSGYVEDALREVRLRFSADCLGEICDALTTCRMGTCSDACAEPVAQGAPFRGCSNADAGVMDAGRDASDAADSGPDPTSCDDEHAGAIFCDGFEGAPGPWADFAGVGTLERSAQSYRGVGALVASLGEVNGSTYVSADPGEGIGADLFVRIYAYIPSDTTASRMNLIFVGEPEEPFGGVVIGAEDGEAFMAVALPESTKVRSEGSIVRDRWTCLEAHLFMDPDDGYVEFWIDEELVDRQFRRDTLPTTAISVINAGLPYTDNEQPIGTRVRLDEVVVDTRRIGCDSTL